MPKLFLCDYKTCSEHPDHILVFDSMNYIMLCDEHVKGRSDPDSNFHFTIKGNSFRS